MKYLGIWHPDLKNEVFLKSLIDLGFNACVMAPDWDKINRLYPTLTPLQKQQASAVEMRNRYEKLKVLGFKFFLNLGSGWGLGEYDKNWFYAVIYEQFKDCDDMLFDLGEFYEDWVETKKVSIQDYNAIVKEKRELFCTKLELGNTARNKEKLKSETLTSYWNQKNIGKVRTRLFGYSVRQHGIIYHHCAMVLKRGIAKKIKLKLHFYIRVMNLPGAVWDGKIKLPICLGVEDGLRIGKEKDL